LQGPPASAIRIALRLAEQLGGEIISAFHAGVSRLDIGTAKPSAADRVRVPQSPSLTSATSDRSFDAAHSSARAKGG